MSLRTKLIGSLLALAVVAGVQAVIALLQANATVTEVATAAHAAFPRVRAMDALGGAVQAVSRITRRASGDAATTGVRSELAEALTRLDRALEESVPMVDADAMLVRDARSTTAAVRDHVARLLESHGAAPADHELHRLEGIAHSAAETIRRAHAGEERRLELLVPAVQARRSLTIVIMACSVCVAILLALLAGNGLTAAMTRDLKRLRDALVALDEGKLDTRAVTSGTEDIAEIGRAFNALALHIQARRRDEEERQRGLMGELGERIATEERLRHEAMHDPLTGLCNRSLLMERLHGCIERARRYPDYRFALLFLDLDRFKMVNDSLGHQVGDELLVEASQRLMRSVRGLDTVVRVEGETTARLGGDEFAILLDGISNPGRAVLIAERIKDCLCRPFILEGHEMAMSTSIGIAIGHAHYTSASEILRDADTAMYRAKLAGGNEHAVFDDVMLAEARKRLELENDLRRATESQQFEIRYQPIVDLKTGRICAFEALIRWQHPERGLISPTEFIPVAEETGLITPIGRWVMREACRQLVAWQRELGPGRPLSISVNVSPHQVGTADLVREVELTLRETGLSPSSLRLEITESMLMDNADSVRRMLVQLKEIGVELHMDDFGTGYSSLSCLHNFPLDVLKIDREFVRNIGDDRDYAAVVRAIMTLAHSLNMRVTTEGLETSEQLALVQSLGCNYGQGYLFAKPLRPAEAWQLLLNDQPLLRSA